LRLGFGGFSSTIVEELGAAGGGARGEGTAATTGGQRAVIRVREDRVCGAHDVESEGAETGPKSAIGRKNGERKGVPSNTRGGSN
jgi:hypothetical protein